MSAGKPAMSLQKLREALLRHSPPRRACGVKAANVIVVGKRMAADGCESIVSLASPRAEERRQRRVVLHGVGPGDVIRAPARHFDFIVEERRLPASAQRRLWRGRGGGAREWGRPRAVACVHHAAPRSCARCPWMGLAAAASREIKAEQLRRAVESALLSSAPSPATEGRPAGLARPPPPVRFLEPFDVPIVAHSMREVEFCFRRPSDDEGLQSGLGEASFPATGRFCFSLSATHAPECFLATPEQQRLLVALNRWAERLSPPVQECLHTAFILQTPQEGLTRTWESDLHVTLLLRQDAASFGDYGPLCSPSQPEGMLALAEQQLVDTVLSAVPLTKRLGIAAVCSNGSIACLYPRPRRVEFAVAANVAEVMGVVPCAAVHGPSGKRVTASLPFVHSTVAAALGSRELTRIDLSSPSVWRQAMSPEAVGSVLLSLLGDLQGGGVVLLLPDPSRRASAEASKLPPAAGSRLLATALSQWLGCVSTTAVAYLGRGGGRASGQAAANHTGLDAAVSSAGSDPAALFCLLDGDTDVEATVNVLRHGVAALRHERPLVRSTRLVLLQLAADGDFRLLGSVLRGVVACAEAQFHLGVECGVVDVDPWNAAAAGYALLRLAPRPAP
ncbi:uncharacterized protein Tco025E_00211 [Trypanosoma conorhini]|uniref:Uncharacterized protein n=1 Tax=Trypanosoma conorhini TaxID=83891 RepID=A0A3R7LHV2_9TRYP|nr:uncharacterized protein Tco025E_00211 [Trypanosoma conorhini]RNF27561.1 hypothetical protein Tco025E_00211 [Trypanosoma conorhini]